MNPILPVILSLLTLNVSDSKISYFFKESIYLEADSVQSRINLVKENGKIKVQGVYVGNNAGTLSYKLIVQKEGNGGSSNNSQSGKFKIVPGQKEVVLSTSSFNSQTNDEFKITLEIYQDTELISQELISYKVP